MYLKQLILKGFKSFADRSVLDLEPGITAVVGPNGSGKSNISDAVLWVLGERNAKNLRGQVMEDVIFAGSSARKSVGVAEVSLVLDNSDGALPVEYNEVTVSRRMYRNGESEYLINGTVVRRLDVLDILHDSGLGTGTHSIISQGHLDSILQSKPEDRRALIEEAAGVLKHKQRKEKSQRKIAQMDQHLARVNDVASELERQLGPLQRKARKALQYQEIASEYDRVRLELAVDDLRNFQTEWDNAVAEEAAKIERLESMRNHVESLEQSFDAIQEQIRQDNESVSSLSQKHSAATSAQERLDSLSLLLKEKKRAAETRSAELNLLIEDNQAKRSAVQEERQKATQDLEQARATRSEAQSSLDEANASYDEAHALRVQLERDLSTQQRRRGDAEREAERKRKELSTTRQQLANSLGKAQAMADYLAEIDQRMIDAQNACEQAANQLAEANKEIAELESAEQESSKTMVQLREQRDAARAKANAEFSLLQKLNAEAAGIKEVERALLAAAGPAHEWVSNQKWSGEDSLHPLFDLLEVDAGYESLVERVLGDDVTALLVQDGALVSRIGSSLAKSGKNGNVTLVFDRKVGSDHSANHLDLLCNHIICADELSSVVSALLGDVAVCETIDEALKLQAGEKSPLRYITRDGGLLWPSGKIQMGLNVAQDENLTLVRTKRLKAIESEIAQHNNAWNELNDLAEGFDTQAKEAQETNLATRQSLFAARGKAQSLKRDATTAQERVKQIETQKANSLQAQKAAQQEVAAAEPKALELEGSISSLEELIESAKAEAADIRAKLNPQRDREQAASTKLADAKILFATLTERETFAARSVDERTRELLDLSSSDDQAFAALQQKKSLVRRIDPLIECIETLRDGVKGTASALAEQVAAAYQISSEAHQKASDAREEVRTAQAALDEINQEIAELRVAKGRIELQVQASVNHIVEDCKTTMEEALELPPLSNRAECEDTAFKLQRKIANLGTINPDAAQEYDELKERYDYLRSQLEDLAAARATLRKIDKVIEERMKDDFVNTFNTVNEHFKVIFAELFPGGSAELTLVDPNDLENTGVEVTAQPRGKRITKMTLMSGGEKSLVACALLFAVYRTRTTPFYILDEIEAALDDSNLRRLIAYLDDLSKTTQLIMITHQRRTMEMADVLFGVSMQADGVTRVISQRLDKALQYAE